MLTFEVHARRLAALKALTSSSTSSSEMMEKLYEIVFGVLEKVGNSWCQLWFVHWHCPSNFTSIIRSFSISWSELPKKLTVFYTIYLNPFRWQIVSRNGRKVFLWSKVVIRRCCLNVHSISTLYKFAYSVPLSFNHYSVSTPIVDPANYKHQQHT
jgi:hypothetical protein